MLIDDMDLMNLACFSFVLALAFPGKYFSYKNKLISFILVALVKIEKHIMLAILQSSRFFSILDNAIF